MQALGLQRSWENIGLRLLFAPVCTFVISKPSGDIPVKKKQALRGLEQLLAKAESGLDLTIVRPNGGFERLGSLGRIDESVKAERAYRFLMRALPPDPKEAKSLITDIKIIINDILEARPYESGKLLNFCEKVLDELEGEYFENLSDDQSSHP